MSFSKVRNAHKTENTEDYLELIAELLNSKGEARIVDIAESLGIAQATANKTIQRLQSQGYIKREPYRSIFLTLKGQKIASESKKRHNIVYNFLLISLLSLILIKYSPITTPSFFFFVCSAKLKPSFSDEFSSEKDSSFAKDSSLELLSA